MEQTELRRCKDCRAMYPPAQFHADRTRHDGLSNRCKACEAKRGLRRQTQRLEGRRLYMQRMKSVPCADCGATYGYWIMQFDHRPGTQKLFNIASWAHFGIAALIEEIDKCDVVCANCHAERSYRRRTAEAPQAPPPVSVTTGDE